MTADQISTANAELRSQTPLEIIRWAIAHANGRAIWLLVYNTGATVDA